MDKHTKELIQWMLVGGGIIITFILITMFYPMITLLAMLIGFFLIMSAAVGSLIVPFSKEMILKYWKVENGSTDDSGAAKQRRVQRDLHKGGRD